MAKDPFLDPANPPDDKALGARIGEAFTVVKAAVEACDTGKARITFAWKFMFPLALLNLVATAVVLWAVQR